MTQARRMVRIIRARAVRIITPMPNREPTETCVVETGKPSRPAPATRTDVTRLAAQPCPGLMRVIFLLMVSATRRAFSSPPTAITPATRTKTQVRVDGFCGQEQGEDLGRIIQTPGKADGPAAQVVQPVQKPTGLPTQEATLIALHAFRGGGDLDS